MNAAAVANVLTSERRFHQRQRRYLLRLLCVQNTSGSFSLLAVSCCYCTCASDVVYLSLLSALDICLASLFPNRLCLQTSAR